MSALRAALVAATVLGACTVVDAGPFRSTNGFTVNQLDSTSFEVSPRGIYSNDDFWCAAGDYARRALGLDWRTNLYVSQGYHTGKVSGRRSSVSYTTDPAAAGIEPNTSQVVTNALGVGVNRTVSTAFNTCSTLRFQI